MAFDRQSHLYVTDGQGLFRVDQQGKISQLMTGFQDAIDLKVDPTGNIYVAEAQGIVSLRSIVVDDKGDVFANIDFPVILRIDAQGQQKQLVIPNNYDFCMGRMAMGEAEGDRQTLYVPTHLGIVRIGTARSF